VYYNNRIDKIHLF